MLAEASYHTVHLEEMNEEVFEKNCTMIYLVFINQGYDYKYSIKIQGSRSWIASPLNWKGVSWFALMDLPEKRTIGFRTH